MDIKDLWIRKKLFALDVEMDKMSFSPFSASIPVNPTLFTNFVFSNSQIDLYFRDRYECDYFLFTKVTAELFQDTGVLHFIFQSTVGVSYYDFGSTNTLSPPPIRSEPYIHSITVPDIHKRDFKIFWNTLLIPLVPVNIQSILYLEGFTIQRNF